jgi:predicted nucleic acid-binding protein
LIRFLKKIFLFLFLSQFGYIILLKFIDAPITLTQIASILQGDGFNKSHVGMHEISKEAKLAVIASEDQLFPDHSGFDFKNIQKALAYNKKKPGRVRGASTISQQVAKNIETLTEFIELLPVEPFEIEAAIEFGKIQSELRKIGKPTGEFDALIAAVARSRDDILVTNNIKDFINIPNLKLDNWLEN